MQRGTKDAQLEQIFNYKYSHAKNTPIGMYRED